MEPFTSRSLLLLATVFTLGYSNAAEPVRMPETVKHTTLERSLERALNRSIAYPLLETGDMTGEVMVSLVIDKEGMVVVQDCRSENSKLKDYVLRKLAHLDIGENPDGMWKTTHIRFNFRPENT
ncbi:MAG: hypothetical protein IPO87_00640 [Flavobacteriales bacterium]|nr:hypothetical protein [Flavobacteriales bacterium]